MKKTNRKLIPAVAMLLISAIMLSTSSFAWFSMNSTVSATGMNVQAESNEVFLEIALKDGAFATAVEYDDAETDGTIKPVYPAKGSVSGKTLTGENKLTASDATAFSEIKWITSTSNNAASPTAAENYALLGGDGKVDTLVSGGYAEKIEYAVRLKTAPAAAQKLTINSVTVTVDGLTTNQKKLLPSLRVMFVTETGYSIYKISEGGVGSVAAASAADLVNPIKESSLANGAPAFAAADKVDVYLFFDGEDPNCFTNNALVASAYPISFVLGCTAA